MKEKKTLLYKRCYKTLNSIENFDSNYVLKIHLLGCINTEPLVKVVYPVVPFLGLCSLDFLPNPRNSRKRVPHNKEVVDSRLSKFQKVFMRIIRLFISRLLLVIKFRWRKQGFKVLLGFQQSRMKRARNCHFRFPPELPFSSNLAVSLCFLHHVLNLIWSFAGR